jgi:pyruvate dehydrogenase E2 component (dihydrolipoamide acetyltransferase)
VLLEVETDKADMEYEAYVSGTLVKILAHEGDTVAVGTPIALVRLESDTDEEIQAALAKLGAGEAPAPEPASEAPAPAAADQEEETEEAPQPAQPSRPAAPEPKPAATPAAAQPAAAGSPAPAAAELPDRETRLAFFLPDPDRVRATPRARMLAAQQHVDLTEIAGSGPEGAVLAGDVERYVTALEQSREPAVAGDVPATPVAVRMADELGIDLSRVKGTGPGGRVSKRDLRAFLERDGHSRAEERALYGDEIKLSQKRKFLTRQMTESKQTTPHFYITMEVDAEPMRALRERLKGEGSSVTYTHMILKAAALALEAFPDVNATWKDDRIVRFNPINIAVAVAVGDELVAPVVKDCHGRSLEALAEDTDELIERARERKLTPEDYSDGTFTISNLGMFGVEHFYAIITPPQATVLSVGRMREAAVVVDGEVRPGLRMAFGLGCDHRVLDGAKASQFLAELKGALEKPERMLEDEGDGA